MHKSSTRLSAVKLNFCEAEQRFLLLFLEKEEPQEPNWLLFSLYKPIGLFLGASPQTPWVGFAEFGVEYGLLRSRTTLFASFSGKRRTSLDQLLFSLYKRIGPFWGQAPKPPGSASPSLG
jgi:hypothetical protein